MGGSWGLTEVAGHVGARGLDDACGDPADCLPILTIGDPDAPRLLCEVVRGA